MVPRKRGVGDNRGDRQRLRRRTRVDGDGLAGGGADIAAVSTIRAV